LPTYTTCPECLGGLSAKGRNGPLLIDAIENLAPNRRNGVCDSQILILSVKELNISGKLDVCQTKQKV
jgi:hypothetical protein